MLHLYVMYIIEKVKDILYGKPCRHCGARGCTKTHATIIIHTGYLRQSLTAEIQAEMERELRQAFERSFPIPRPTTEQPDLLEPWRKYIEGGE